MIGRLAGQHRPSIGPGTWLGLGGAPAGIVAAATGHDVPDPGELVTDNGR